MNLNSSKPIPFIPKQIIRFLINSYYSYSFEHYLIGTGPDAVALDAGVMTPGQVGPPRCWHYSHVGYQDIMG